LADDYLLTYDGDCPICEKPTTFTSKDRWLRGGLTCKSCTNGSVPRERALAHVLNRTRPGWRNLAIHESSPANRGISHKMGAECKNYIGSHYYPDKNFGEMVNGFRNESLEEQTFSDELFDIVVTLDVFEHVFQPGKMIKEIYRTLKPGGIYISTFPIRKYLVTSHHPRVRKEADGSLTHLDTPEIHGNPVSGEGALVTFDYGYDIHNMLAYWVPFEVEISRFNNRRLGILGEYTEVIVCAKAD
jgi:SAM-dependent methyltransferase